MLGCGKNEVLTFEKRSFCCEQFNLDCNSQQVPKKGLERGSNRIWRARIRVLGEACSQPLYVCAVGLECKQGLCFRKKTKEHLKMLLRRGRKVEEEERAQMDNGADVRERDPLPAQKGLILKGQSLHFADGGGKYRSDDASSLKKGMRKPASAEEIDSSGIEEDEVTANIRDVLNKTGIRLNAAQVHNMRDVIAGTLDERAEREEQVEESEAEKIGRNGWTTRGSDSMDGRRLGSEKVNDNGSDRDMRESETLYREGASDGVKMQTNCNDYGYQSEGSMRRMQCAADDIK